MTGVARQISTLLATLLIATSCAGVTVAEDDEAATESSLPAIDYVGTMDLVPSHGLPGTSVTVTGTDLPASSQLSLQWGTAEGNWVIRGERGEEYHGRTFETVYLDLGTVQTSETGSFSTTFEVPEDFGFAHDVVLVDQEGVVRNQAMFDVEMEVSVTPSEGPVGTPITIEVRGMGWQTLENTRAVTYDNAYTGWLSAVTTRGHARAVIPATGEPGPHRIGILRGAYTFPYLNPEQSPRPDIDVYDAVFTVTEGDPVLPPSLEEQNPATQPRSATNPPGDTPWVSTDLASGPVETPLVISGGGFEPGAEVAVEWFRIVGNRVSGQGWDEQSLTLDTVATDEDGYFELAAVVPGDVGGGHRIEAVVSEETVASTDFLVTPAAVSMTPSSGPWGTEITITLTGVGWTETANIYTLVYDNSYLGYACGFNSQGDVEISLQATGDPGWHFIDLYPAIYKGEESPGQQNFRIPQLTYEADHPGEDLPAFHFAFYLEG